MVLFFFPKLSFFLITYLILKRVCSPVYGFNWKSAFQFFIPTLYLAMTLLIVPIVQHFNKRLDIYYYYLNCYTVLLILCTPVAFASNKFSFPTSSFISLCASSNIRVLTGEITFLVSSEHKYIKSIGYNFFDRDLV